MGDDEAVTIAIGSDTDVVTARQQGRARALAIGFSSTDATLIATAISELARNIVAHAGRGEVEIRVRRDGARAGLVVIARDEGPGIANVEQALQDGFSTTGSLGLGLPGVRRLMDECEVESTVGAGTTVTLTKWVL